MSCNRHAIGAQFGIQKLTRIGTLHGSVSGPEMELSDWAEPEADQFQIQKRICSWSSNG